MENSKVIRIASEKDSQKILKIYEPYIKNTAVTFEYEVPDVSEFSKRINKIQRKYPYLVCEINNEITGYAYASQFRERAAFDWSVELSVYISSKYHRKNIGKALYNSLLEILKLMGYYNAYALITSPNKESESFHTSLGFTKTCFYKEIGYKFNKWHDLKCYELLLNKHTKAPSSLININDPKISDKLHDILESASIIIK